MLDAGLSFAAKANEFNKRSSLRDVGALAEVGRGFRHGGS